MKRLLLTSIAALALFIATQPMSAIEWQGKLPTPVQKLPHYPPVVCVATDWATEPCEGRQTPLPQPNPFRAFATRKRIPAKTKTVLYDEYGGILQEHIQRFQALAASGDDVEIRGILLSLYNDHCNCSSRSALLWRTRIAGVSFEPGCGV